MWFRASSDWFVQDGTTYQDIPRTVAVDSSGNVYVGGYTKGSIGGSTIISDTNDIDAILVKYDSAGNREWGVSHGTTSQDVIYSMFIDSSDTLWAAVSTSGTWTGLTSAGGMDMVILKLSIADGSQQMAVQAGSSSGDEVRSIALDSAGNIVITGNVQAALTGQEHYGSNDLAILKFNSTGDQQWAVQFGSDQHDYGSSVVIDSSDEIYSCGWNQNSGNFDGHTSVGDTDIILVKVRGVCKRSQFHCQLRVNMSKVSILCFKVSCA